MNEKARERKEADIRVYEKRPTNQPVSLKIPTEYAELGREIAARKNLPYITYLKELIKEGIDRDKNEQP